MEYLFVFVIIALVLLLLIAIQHEKIDDLKEEVKELKESNQSLARMDLNEDGIVDRQDESIARSRLNKNIKR
jgi:cell division protein FtsI/penicillin-binding protein 2